ncbi:MAG: hydroxymethylglutaryl-CoA lyase [Planctomycetota bacterium]|jgi:hydroxymethylglutaryl-CoA lyase
MSEDDRVHITEVGPRDGLQNERVQVVVADKVRFVDLLSAACPHGIEVSSFVSPRWVPQLADAADVLAGIDRRPGITYSALVPNERGLDGALAAGVDAIAVFTAASETFSRQNTNATIDETLARFAPVVRRAHEAGMAVRGYVSCVVRCPYEGPVAPAGVRNVAASLLELGVDEIDLGDTIGVAVPTDIERLYEGLDGLLTPGQTVLHLHDTRGTALACVVRALQLGVRRFDASCAGIGGCPYAPGAAGNVATEDLVYLLESMGYRTGIDLAAQLEAARHIAGVLERPLPGRVLAAEGRLL